MKTFNGLPVYVVGSTLCDACNPTLVVGLRTKVSLCEQHLALFKRVTKEDESH